jgi:MOSC domain-containing protein YiiM
VSTLLFRGELRRIDEHGQWTGIYKQPVDEPIRIGFSGLDGDRQADRRVHGGLEKAVHFYPVDHYRYLATRFPAIAEQLVAGSIGENLSAGDLDEKTVFIGDIFRLGGVRLQVTQPRSPCWKIDARYGFDGLAQAIATTGVTGWYFRVLDEGMVDPGDELRRVERLPDAISLAESWQVWREHRPETRRLERLLAAPGLTDGWREKVRNRLLWLVGKQADDPSV